MEAVRGYWRLLEADGVYAHLVDLLVDRTVVLSVPPRLLGLGLGLTVRYSAVGDVVHSTSWIS